MKNDSTIIDNLFRLASDLPNETRAKLASCIVYKNKIVAYGFNSKKSHPFQHKYGRNDASIYLHSEVDVIKNALRILDVDQLRKSTLYIARAKRVSPLTSEMIPGMAKPCPGCQRCISTFEIKRVVYTLDNDGFSDSIV